MIPSSVCGSAERNVSTANCHPYFGCCENAPVHTRSSPALTCPRGPARVIEAASSVSPSVEATRLPLDETFPSWGESDYFSVRLRRQCRLSELLSHLYVLI